MNTSVYSTDFITIHGQTDPGRSGKNNEDSWDRFSILVPDGSGSGAMQNAELIVVADGIGGARGGEVASSESVRVIGALMERERTPTRSIEQRLDSAIKTANKTVYDKAAKDSSLMGMGTTLLAVVITKNRRCYVAHAGDSRAYLIRGNRIQLLTQDHTRVQEMVDMGRLTLEEAKEHPNRHVVSRFLGINDAVEVDMNLLQQAERGEAAIKVPYLDLQPGDMILCCSDGLNDMLDDSRILELVRRNGVQNAPAELVKAANEEGGDDNITAVVASLLGVGGVPVTPPTGAKRGLPVPLLLGLVLLLLVGAGAVYMMMNGVGGVQGATATEVVAVNATEATGAAAGTATPEAGGTNGDVPPTATEESGETPVENTPQGNGTAPVGVATSTRLVPPTNTPVPPTNTPPPTNTRSPNAPTPRPTNSPRATTAGAPTAAQAPTQPPPPPTSAPATNHSAVVIVAPGNNEAFSVGQPITFSWQGQTLAAGESYRVRVWKQASPNVMERTDNTTATSITFTGLNPESYQWSVDIVNGGNVVSGTSSGNRSFSVTGGGGEDPPPDDPPPPEDPPPPPGG